jgi:hypothetical protein
LAVAAEAVAVMPLNMVVLVVVLVHIELDRYQLIILEVVV